MFEGPRLLVVDDSFDFRAVSQKSLGIWGR